MVDNFIDKVIDEASKMKNHYKNYAEKQYKFTLLTED
jgi:hypothetical protein